MKSKLKPLTLSIGLAAGVFASGIHAGGLSGTMQEVFDGYMTSAGPDEYKSALGTTIQGGYVKYRTPTKSLGRVVDFKSPSFRGGCNGFDLFKGSMYYISGERLIEFLEQVAQDSASIATYAFMTGLAQSCSVCNETMEKLRKAVNFINQYSIGSCKAAENLMSASGLDFEAAGLSVGNAIKKQFVKADGNGLESEEEMKTSGADEETIKNHVLGNMLIFAMVNTPNLSSLFGVSTDAEKKVLYEQLMSLYGSVIVTTIKNDAGKVEKTQVTPIDPVLGFKELVFGTIESTSQIYQCDNIPAEMASANNISIGCTNVTPIPVDIDNEIVGLSGIIKKQFEGPDGILNKIDLGSEDFTEEQKAFLTALSKFSKMTNLLMNLKPNPTLMWQFYLRHSEYLSTMIAYEIMDNMDKILHSSLKVLKDYPGAKEMLAHFNKNSERVRDQARVEMTRMANFGDIYGDYKNFASQIQKAR